MEILEGKLYDDASYGQTSEWVLFWLKEEQADTFEKIDLTKIFNKYEGKKIKLTIEIAN